MKLTNRLILVIILLTAAALRFYNFFEIPFTHDEFSALFRLSFGSFSELIAKGVKIDGHPAGVHVFLYYWTALFGSEEWVVKLPFAVMGLGAIYLTYRVGKEWFNESTGLISAAYLASIQFAVIYSQIARPYGSGIFLSLLMVFFWTRLMRHPENRFWLNWSFFVLSAALCAYNHHFSLLFAALVGMSGLFFIKRTYRVKYIFSGVFIFLLYLPHLNIFFYQLGVGGVESWLAKPANDWFLHYLYYIFNFSTFGVFVALAILIFAILNLHRSSSNFKYIGLSLSWFILPFLIGFYYSRYGHAVLQYSVLIFSFPFLFYFLFGWLREQKAIINLLIVLLVLTVNSLTLIFGRKHYELFYTSIYRQILVDYQAEKYASPNEVFLISSHDRITDYYLEKLSVHKDFIQMKTEFQHLRQLALFLEKESQTKDALFLGRTSDFDPNIIPIIQDYFPNIEWQRNYADGSTSRFSKGERTGQEIVYFKFDSEIPKGWTSIDARMIERNTPGDDDLIYRIKRSVEWGPTVAISLDSVLTNQNNFIDISVEVKTDTDFNEILLVASIDSDGKNLFWGATDCGQLATLQLDSIGNSWQRFHLSVKLSDIDIQYENPILKAFIWNKGQKECCIDNFRISIRTGNPLLYGLVEKL